MLYENYNREELNLLSHLFRLLHEPKERYSALRQFLGRNCDGPKVKVFSGVSLIRDAYNARRPDVALFMSSLVNLIAKQNSLENYTPFDHLPDELKDPLQTNPEVIAVKFKKKFQYRMCQDDCLLYGIVRRCFRAKPDLAVCLENEVLIYEAKFNRVFNQEQLQNIAIIGKVWSELLFRDLGFKSPPKVKVMRLGFEKNTPDVSWEKIALVAHEILGGGDKTSRALKLAVVNN